MSFHRAYFRCWPQLITGWRKMKGPCFWWTRRKLCFGAGVNWLTVIWVAMKNLMVLGLFLIILGYWTMSSASACHLSAVLPSPRCKSPDMTAKCLDGAVAPCDFTSYAFNHERCQEHLQALANDTQRILLDGLTKPKDILKASSSFQTTADTELWVHPQRLSSDQRLFLRLSGTSQLRTDL